MHFVVLLLTGIFMHACAAASIDDDVDGPAVDAPAQADDDAGAPAVVAETAEEVLALLEADIEQLEDFTASIRLEKEDPIHGDPEISLGEAFFMFDHEQDVKKFAIHFDRKITGNRMVERSEQYIFDGVWLAERHEELKQFIARQMVGPGEKLDPLKLGEGPIPLPIGQPKDEVLRRYNVTMIDKPQDESSIAKAIGDREVYGLELTPREELADVEEYETVRIFFDRDLLLPLAVDAVKPGGVHTRVILRDVKRNIGLEADRFDTTAPTEPGWRIDIREWDEGEK